MTTPTTVNARFQLRADTAANWASVNPTLLTNELGLETDTKKLKVGDGSTAWNSLGYFPSIVSGGTVLGNLEIGTTGTLTFEGSTADGFETTLAVTDPTADRTITLPDQSGTVVVSGNASITDADIAANAEIAVSKLANGTANQVIVTDGTNVSWSDNLTLAGDLTVNGTTTTINTETLTVKDKNIELAVVDTPTDVTADGGGITLKGTTDKTLNWVDATDSWTSSEHVDLASGKSYRINGTEVLSSTTLGSGVTGSSLTSVGTIATGVWQGTAIDATYLDSTIVTTGDTGTVTSTMIADGTIVDGDINASAAIAGTKISPNFGSQNVVTTGTSTAASFIPTSSTVPTNGVYLPAANSVALSTNGTGRLFVGSDGSVGIGAAAAATIPLDIADTGSGIRIKNAASGNYAIGLLAGTGSQDAYVYQRASAPLILGTNNSERLRITAAGLVGVGSSVPVSRLDTDGAGGAPNATAATTAANASIAISSSNGLGTATRLFGGVGSSSYVWLQSQSTFNNNANALALNPIGGNVGIGTSTVDELLHVESSGLNPRIKVESTGANSYPGVRLTNDARTYDIQVDGATDALRVYDATAAAGRISIASNGDINIDNGGVFYDASTNRLAIGTASAGYPLEVAANTGIIAFDVDGINGNKIRYGGAGANANVLRFLEYTGAERARIDSSGRLLVGTSSNHGTERVLINGNSAGAGDGSLTLRRGSDASSGDGLGLINFADTRTSSLYAKIQAEADAAPGASDFPGRLVFSTTADGASSPTERMRIRNTGAVLFGATDDSTSATSGVYINAFGGATPTGLVAATRSSASPYYANRLTNDGDLFVFSQNTITEGSISVSGTTVSYNGAHLSRWSQLPGGVERTEILRGTVLSNIDEMCEWGDEDNEQLNRMKVSDVEGDKNVSGVFQAWDDDDETYTNDFYCAMTGDFVIRIGAGVTVQRGDLLMSAGDGTAKPQDDDIIRSKTIAKVTSTTVSCTYDDGSYCVPCVLMAC